MRTPLLMVMTFLVLILTSACMGPTPTPVSTRALALDTPLPTSTLAVQVPTEVPAPPTAVVVQPTLPPPTAIPTVAPSPTPDMPTAFGGTVTIEGWVVSLGRLEWHQQLPGAADQADGDYWLVWVDARNSGSGTRSLAGDFQWQVLTDRAEIITELSETGAEAAKAVAVVLGRDALEAGVQPGALAHALLIFPLTPDSGPRQLLLTRTTASHEHTRFELSTGLPAAYAAATVVARSSANATATVVQQEAVARHETATAVAGASHRTAAEAAYIEAVSDQSGRIGNALEALSGPLSNPKLTSSNWQISVAVEIATIRQAVKEGLALSAPDRLRAVDTPYKRGLRHFGRAMDLMVSGIDQLDMDDLTAAAEEMDAGGQAITEAGRALTTFTAQYK